MQLDGLFMGKLQAFGPRGKDSGIIKMPVEQVKVEHMGIVGDHQGDKKVHGGPEKALHQYAPVNYQQLIAAYPQLAGQALPGTIGENMSSGEMNDNNVYIGDIYQLDQVRLQVSAPRIPCWKIAHRYDVEGLDKFVGEQRITGWYYRVLSAGEMSVGETFTLTDRFENNLSVAEFMAVINKQRNDEEAILQACRCIGLDPQWQQRLKKRLG